VSSVISEVVTFFESGIETAVPALKKSKFYYDFDRNPGTKNNYIYAVTPGPASPVDGTIRHVTMQQDFVVQIARDYSGSENNDESVRDAIETIFSDSELIMKEVSLRKDANILVIQSPSFERPEIHQDGRSVSISFTYPVIYRKSIKGD
jgi:hypothetical protein